MKREMIMILSLSAILSTSVVRADDPLSSIPTTTLTNQIFVWEQKAARLDEDAREAHKNARLSGAGNAILMGLEVGGLYVCGRGGKSVLGERGAIWCRGGFAGVITTHIAYLRVSPKRKESAEEISIGKQRDILQSHLDNYHNELMRRGFDLSDMPTASVSGSTITRARKEIQEEMIGTAPSASAPAAR